MNVDQPPPAPGPSSGELLSQTSRAGFLRRLLLAMLGTLSVATGPSVRGAAVGTSSLPAAKSGKDSKVRRWDVITIGNLSRNRYWGEPDAKGVRSAICTCTLVQGDGFRLVVDPSLSDAEAMAKELDRRTGLKPPDITAAFITHEHGDHWSGLAHFPEARWLAAPDVATALNKTGKLAKRVEPATGRLFEVIEILPTPGHTLSHHSLLFDCGGLPVILAGDAVATRDFWRERRGYFNCVDFELSAKSMDKIAGLAELIVPGHDNYFLNLK